MAEIELSQLVLILIVEIVYVIICILLSKHCWKKAIKNLHNHPYKGGIKHA